MVTGAATTGLSATLLGASAAIDRPVATDLTVLLFHCAPDGRALERHPRALLLHALVGEPDGVKDEAFALARMLLEGEPRFDGIQQLSVFEEHVIGELVRGLTLARLARALAGRGVVRCVVEGSDWIAGGLAHAAHALGFPMTVEARGSAPSTSPVRAWRRLRDAGFSLRSVRGEWHNVLRRADPFHRRARQPGAGVARGRSWFYATAENYARIGLLYEPFVEDGFEYLVENPLTGGAPLKAAGREATNVYAFGDAADEPAAPEVAQAGEAIRGHLASRDLAAPEHQAARAALLSSAFMRTFFGRLLPQGLFATRLFRRWAEQAEPRALVVGNPVFEAYALHAARSRGIPTVVLQHGILGDFCQYVAPPVDHYVVRGEFWKAFLSRPAARKAIVLDPVPASPAATAAGPRDAIVFLTAPYHLQWAFHLADQDDILAALLRASRAAGKELVVRVHPLEDPGWYRQRVAALGGGDARVSFSQGEGLQALLQRAAVAVTFNSTVFLDCLRLRVPIVGFDWHPFSYKRAIEPHRVFRFAATLAELQALVERAARGDLPPAGTDTAPFVAATPPGDLRERLQQLLAPATAGAAQ